MDFLPRNNFRKDVDFLTIQQLKYAVTAAEKGTMSEAAQSLFLSQPSLTAAIKELEKELSKVELSGLKIPYVTNVTAQYVTDISETKNLLARQISSSVLWQQSVENMIRQGVDTFVEIGPGRTLAGFMRKIDRNVKVYNIQTVEDAEKVCQELV